MTSRDADDVDAETATDSQEVATVLADLHLPELAEAGYIEWDPTTETIRRGPNFEAIVPVIRRLEIPDEDW